jgi:hypothetical protein
MHAVFRRLSAPMLSALSFISLPLAADADHHFSGFASLGLVSNSNQELIFRRDIAQNQGSSDSSLEWTTDSLIGAQWQTRWSNKIDTSLQLVAKDRFNNTLDSAVEWGFIRYRPLDGLDLRLGRLGMDTFMLSDYRQVSYAYQWVRPPHDFYALLSLYNFDGIDLSKRIDFSNSSLLIKTFYGKSQVKYPIDSSGKEQIELDFVPSGISFNFETGAWKARYSFAQVTIKNDALEAITNALQSLSPLWLEAPWLAQQVSTKDKEFRYYSLGLAYDNNSWWMQTEVSQLRSQTGLTPQSFHTYLSLGKRIEKFSLYVIGGYARPERGNINVSAPSGYPSPLAEQLAQVEAITEVSLNGVRIRQKSLGLGVRWDLATKVALKLQVDKFHIDKNGTQLWLTASPDRPVTHDQEATVVSLTMDLLF